ncbi:hypothetical protein PILCRDRAFT_200987 [Piloderma croceum F 1598]|uniref:Uncharacterized protein n=1 Tax=Piloderma croceum (strain F 1598) TaxID=765440 RepID=A0A0C3GDZ1_PILCF|nr:hypothetical protein PILCRDRAFT_200987 [Piloderma croceum F 1598]
MCILPTGNMALEVLRILPKGLNSSHVRVDHSAIAGQANPASPCNVSVSSPGYFGRFMSLTCGKQCTSSSWGDRELQLHSVCSLAVSESRSLSETFHFMDVLQNCHSIRTAVVRFRENKDTAKQDTAKQDTPTSSISSDQLLIVVSPHVSSLCKAFVLVPRFVQR